MESTFGKSEDNSSVSEAKLRRLTAAYCDEANSSAEHAELQKLLEQSETARRMFLDDLCIHAGLEWDLPARECVAKLLKPVADGEGVELASSCESLRPSAATSGQKAEEVESSSRRPWVWFAVAASLLLAVSAFLFIEQRDRLVDVNPEKKIKSVETDRLRSAELQPVIADIEASSSGCRWIFETQDIFAKPSAVAHSEVRAGDTLRVVDGTMQLTFDHGTEVTLAAPTILEVVSPMRSRLLRGRARVTVAPGAEGFTIDTPRTSVIDLGTEFGVEVDDFGCTDVVVFSGMVDVAFSSDVEDSTNTKLGKQRLYMGGAMHVNERGTASRIISLNSDRFAFNRGESQARSTRESLIKSVNDNLWRTDEWQYYEIVTEGMREDAKAFVDRLHHEWNGADAKGMPSYLIGGDYIKTFNSDKTTRSIEVTVSLRQPAMLYVLWCKRTPPPEWLTEKFEDTGDEIGVDEGDHQFRDGTRCVRGEPEVGPGASVDSIHTVWQLAVTEPGEVKLGSTEASDGNVNMYGVVATPLPSDGL